MIAAELISVRIEPVQSGTAASDILEMMERFKVTNWPVAAGTDYIGLVSESDLEALGSGGNTLTPSGIPLPYVYVFEDQHLFEVIDVFVNLKAGLIPVLSREKTYKGGIRIADLVPGLAVIAGSGQPGAVLVLSMAIRDYTLNGISRIVEENNSKIICMYTSNDPESGDLLVTLKLNTDEITAIIRSFERFGITVKSHFQGDREMDEMYRTRFEELMRYINT